MSHGPRRILLAWEGGAGRGHIVTLRTIAEALGNGFRYDAALCRMEHAAEIAPICDLVFKGATLWLNRDRRRQAGDPPTATWGEFLGDARFCDPQFLITQLEWWTQTIDVRRIAMVIADMSPCALLAARIAGIPAVAVGTGYSVPPPGLVEFPVLLPQYSTKIFDEADLLASTNAALAHFGAPPLARLTDIYAAPVSLPRTIPALDPYDGLRTAPLLPPLSQALGPAEALGDEVFIYFSRDELKDAAVLEAITSLGVPARAYIPGIEEAAARQVSAGGIVLETAPVPAHAIGRRSRIMLHSGQHGSLCTGLGLGVTQVALPQHREQLFHARRASALGTVDTIEQNGRDAATIQGAILSAYHDAARHTAARDLSGALSPVLFGDTAELVRAAILPVLA